MFASPLSKVKTLLPALCLVLATALLGACATTEKEELPKVGPDGLVLVEGTKIDAVYRHPDADFSQYNRVVLADAQVAFKKDWLRDQNRDRARTTNRVTQEDADRIKAALAKEFNRVFTEELEKAGYEVVSADKLGDSAEDVLVLTPGIINLDVTAPDTQSPGRSRTYTTSAASMTLVMQFNDSITGALLGRVADSQSAVDRGYMTVTNSVTNKAEADRMLRKWAKLLVQGLDRANGK